MATVSRFKQSADGGQGRSKTGGLMGQWPERPASAANHRRSLWFGRLHAIVRLFLQCHGLLIPELAKFYGRFLW